MLESQNTPPNEDSTVPPKPANEDSRPKSRQDKIDEVVNILEGNAGKPTDGQGNLDNDGKPTGQNEDSQKPVKPTTLEAVAEALGIEVADLYDIGIGQPKNADGETETVTLGELADLAKDKVQFETDRLELDESRRKQEQKFVRAQQQLNEIISMLPKSAVSQDLVNAVAAKMADDQARERVHTLSAIPGWSDESVEETERQAMQQHMDQYGFSPNYVASIHDHKTLKYIRDNWQRQEQMERALAVMRKAKTKAQAPSAPKGKHKAPPEPKSRSSAKAGPKSRDAKAAAVADLLRNNED